MNPMLACARSVLVAALLLILAGCVSQHIPPTEAGSMAYCGEDAGRTKERITELAAAMDATVTYSGQVDGDALEVYYLQDASDGQMRLNLFVRPNSLSYHYYRRGKESQDDVKRRLLELKRFSSGYPGGCALPVRPDANKDAIADDP